MAGVRDFGSQRAVSLQTASQDVQRRSRSKKAEHPFESAEAGGGVTRSSEFPDGANCAIAEGILPDRIITVSTAKRKTIGFGGEGGWKEAIEARTLHAESQ